MKDMRFNLQLKGEIGVLPGVTVAETMQTLPQLQAALEKAGELIVQRFVREHGLTTGTSSKVIDFSITMHAEEISELGMSADRLRERYDALAEDGQWGHHPEHDFRDWQEEVATDECRSGYWEWVVSKIEQQAQLSAIRHKEGLIHD